MISRETTTSGIVNLESAPVETNVGKRLIDRLNAKNDQAADGGLVWVRLEEYAELWQSTLFQGMPLSEKLDSLAPFLQNALASFPNLAGVILPPAVLWAGDAPSEALSARIERNGGIACAARYQGIASERASS